KELIIVSYDQVRILGTETKQISRLVDPFGENPHTGQIEFTKVSQDGKTIVTAGRDRTIQLWDRSRNRRVQLKGQHQIPTALSVAYPNKTDSGLVASGDSSGNIRLWNFTGGEPVQQFQTAGISINDLHFTQDR